MATYPLLLDENVDREVKRRLEAGGHDVRHVVDVDALGTGARDDSIAAFSRDTGRFVVTYDDDFVTNLEVDEYSAVLYFGDQTISAKQVADAVQRMSEQFPPDRVRGLVYQN